jgi:transposase-like protein
MSNQRAMTADHRRAAVAVFATGHGRDTVAHQLGVSVHAVRKLYDRWQLWGADALDPTPTRRTYPFALKAEVVQQFLAGETKLALAKAYGLSSPQLVATWVRIYRAEGEDGLRPKPIGRPKRDPDAPVREETELERLRRENERLRAEVAYLEKLRALIAAERR